ncbi:MAG: hypothetical protein U9P42_01945 [Candidatus Fermentibacteria bacterium]|nr:hypothetical protein [Candidatus Fermentibacteria bacterium]
MRKLLIVLAVLAVTAFASDPRLTVLGGDARLLVNDYLEMWAYPGIIGDYEFVTGGSETAGDVTDGWFGIVDGLGGNAYGVTINHNDYSHEILFSPGGWGAILSMDFDKWAPSDTTTQKDMAAGLAWGTDVPFLADYSDLAFAVGFDKALIDWEENEWSNTNIMFGASLRGHGNDFFNLFPIIGADVSMHDVNDYDDTSINTTTIHIDFGAGRNKKVGDKTNLVLGIFTDLQLTSHGGDYEEGATPDSEMWIEIPRVTGGVEQEIGKWLIFRAGAASVAEYYSTGDFNQFTSGFETNFGVGLHWDNFIMDATISEGFLHDGPYMVGGTDNGFMGSLAATYNF